MSSFQVEDATAFAPDTALLLNLAEDHLDRHGTFEAYREAKLRVFARQTEPTAVASAIAPDVARRVTSARRAPTWLARYAAGAASR